MTGWRGASGDWVLFLGVSLLLVGCEDDPAMPDPGPPIQGRVVAVDGGDITGLTVTWRTDETPAGVSGSILGDGTFTLQPADASESGELLIDDPAPRAYHPFLFPFHRDSVGGSDLLLVPMTWTIVEGDYAGRSVPVSLDLAMEDDAGNFLYSYFWAQPEPFNAPTTYRVELVTWLEEAFPLDVAMDHANSTSVIAPADSAAIWGVLNRMEAGFGRDLFRPVVADPSWWTAPWIEDPQPVSGVVRVVHDPPAWRGPFHTVGDPTEWSVELGSWAQGGRFSAFEVTRQFLDAGPSWWVSSKIYAYPTGSSHGRRSSRTRCSISSGLGTPAVSLPPRVPVLERRKSPSMMWPIWSCSERRSLSRRSFKRVAPSFPPRSASGS